MDSPVNHRQILWILGSALLAALFVGGLWGVTAVSARNRGSLPAAFTYQGRLDESGLPAEGSYDFQFRLYDDTVGGNQVGSELTVDDVPVAGGLFTVLLDFGPVFDQAPLYLEMGVRDGASSGSYTLLSPRQPLTPAPYALYSSSTPWTGLTEVPAEFADGSDDDTLALLACSNGQIAEWDGAAWVCGDDDVGAGGGGGDITAVGAGEGLLGGGSSGSVTLTVAFSGTGSAMTVPRSDHDHDIRYYTETELGTSGASSVHWDNLATVPAGFADGIDDDTTYLAGTGLLLISDTFEISTTHQLPQGCAGGQIAAWTGTGWVCADDDVGAGGGGDITAVSAGDGLLGGGTTGGVTLTVNFGGNGSATSASRSDHDHDVRYYTETELQTSGAASMHWDNVTNVPPDLADGDDDTTYTAGNGLVLNGTEFAAQGTPFTNVVIVAQNGGDFSSIQTAINSISNASASNPYLVWVAPGVYSEQVTLKAHVHLQGAAEDAVIIESSASTSVFPPDAATLVLTDSVSVRDLTVINTGSSTRNTAVLAPANSGTSTLARITIRTEGVGTIGYGIYALGPNTRVFGADLHVIVENNVDVFGLALDAAAVMELTGSEVEIKASTDDAFGIYVIDAGSMLTATHSTVLALGDDDSYGAYSSSGQLFFKDSSLTGRGNSTFATDSLGIYAFGDLVADNVTAVGENGRFYNYGLRSFGDLMLLGGLYEGRGGTGGSNVNAAVGIHSRGTTYAEGVTARGLGHASRNQGLDNEGGVTTLVGGYFYGEGGTTAYGIENFGTGSILTATAVSAIGRNGTSGNYGLYNGGVATLYGGTFTGYGSGAVFGTYGINNIFSIGDLKAYGVTAVGRNGGGEVWGLRNWLGTVLLDGGSFTAISGTIAYGLDNDTSNASLTALNVTAVAENARDSNYGLFNRSSADAVLRNSSFTGRGGSVEARGIFNQGGGTTIQADNIVATGENNSALNQGLRNQNSAVANLTNSRLEGTSSNALYMSSGTVRLGTTQLDGSATRTSGSLTCFQAYDGNFAAYTCP